MFYQLFLNLLLSNAYACKSYNSKCDSEYGNVGSYGRLNGSVVACGRIGSYVVRISCAAYTHCVEFCHIIGVDKRKQMFYYIY